MCLCVRVRTQGMRTYVCIYAQAPTFKLVLSSPQRLPGFSSQTAGVSPALGHGLGFRVVGFCVSGF